MLRHNITPSIIVLSFVTRIQLKVVSLSEESENEARPVLMVFRHVDTWKGIVSLIVRSHLPLKGLEGQI